MKQDELIAMAERSRLAEQHATLPKTKEEWLAQRRETRSKRLLWVHRAVGLALLLGAVFAATQGIWGTVAVALLQAWQLLRWEPTG